MMAGTEMMRVADLSKIEAIVDVGENDIPKVHLDDSAFVEVDAYTNRKFRGVVTQIASSSGAAGSSTTVSTNDVTNYKVHVRLSPDSYKDLIDPKRPKYFPFRPGMSATADIQTRTHTNVLSVPINAVTTREKNSDKAMQSDKKNNNSPDDSKTAAGSGPGDMDVVAFVLQPGDTVKKVNVRTDIQDINYIEIVDGLKEGDMVITGPYSIVSKTLKRGTKVKVVPKDKLFEGNKN
jgi:HlyD family secretion protein